LAGSVSHLLAVIEQLESADAHFRSLQVLGAVAQLERR
jgi:hypothetical protein